MKVVTSFPIPKWIKFMDIEDDIITNLEFFIGISSPDLDTSIIKIEQKIGKVTLLYHENEVTIDLKKIGDERDLKTMNNIWNGFKRTDFLKEEIVKIYEKKNAPVIKER